MGDYSIEFDRRVKKDLKSVPTQEMERIKAAISNLSSNPRPSGCKKLKGKNYEYFRIRVGDYRVVYTINDKVLLIIIIRVGHRKEIYQSL